MVPTIPDLRRVRDLQQESLISSSTNFLEDKQDNFAVVGVECVIAGLTDLYEPAKVGEMFEIDGRKNLDIATSKVICGLLFV